MPRDTSGVYTLPVGNPVITDTVIEAPWANTTMNDIAAQLNNVITRDGLLGPIGPFKVGDGTVNAPGLSFNSEPGMGWFKPGAGLMSLAQGGAEIARWDSADPANTVLRVYSKSGAGISGVVVANVGFGGNGSLLRMRATQTEAVIDTLALGTGTASPLHIVAPTLTVDGTVNFSGQVNMPNAVIAANAQYALQVRSGAVAAGAPITFNWAGLGGQPTWVFGGTDPSNISVYNPASWSVNYAASAGSATNAGTASNSNAVNGISGWTYTNSGANPAYIWCTDGSGTYQHLTQPGNLSVNYANSANSANSANYANSAGSAPANGGTAQNSNQLGGVDASGWLRTGGGNLTSMRNVNNSLFGGSVTSVGEGVWNVSGLSDARLKKDVAPTEVDSLAQIAKIRFIQYRFRDDIPWTEGPDDPPDHDDIFAMDDGRLHAIGMLAQEAEVINHEWVLNEGTWKQLDMEKRLMSAMHAIQQLNARVDSLVNH